MQIDISKSKRLDLTIEWRLYYCIRACIRFTGITMQYDRHTESSKAKANINWLLVLHFVFRYIVVPHFLSLLFSLHVFLSVCFFAWKIRYNISSICGDACSTPRVMVTIVFWIGYFKYKLAAISGFSLHINFFYCCCAIYYFYQFGTESRHLCIFQPRISLCFSTNTKGMIWNNLKSTTTQIKFSIYLSLIHIVIISILFSPTITAPPSYLYLWLTCHF